MQFTQCIIIIIADFFIYGPLISPFSTSTIQPEGAEESQFFLISMAGINDIYGAADVV